MKRYSLFTDVSLNPKIKFGIGAYLYFPSEILEHQISVDDLNKLSDKIVYQKFSNISSTNLEVRTVLLALEKIKKELAPNMKFKLTLYSDSQCITGLLIRRTRLEENDFVSKGKNRLLNNASLYKEFYQYYDEMNFDIIKVIGHLPSRERDTIQKFFSLVDRGARRELEIKLKS